MFFNPAKTIGGLRDTDGHVSPSTDWFNQHDMPLVENAVSHVVWLSGRTFGVAFLKANWNKPPVVMAYWKRDYRTWSVNNYETHYKGHHPSSTVRTARNSIQGAIRILKVHYDSSTNCNNQEDCTVICSLQDAEEDRVAIYPFQDPHLKYADISYDLVFFGGR
ncbi:hypothetical protein BC936DRAFT_149961 [Jimgerdemannia flammicorona]|uniref:Uncharacterized protein n=1 Tax=Jimgerdemannia flammicorona TaxID=994334 RepID=A0A433CZS5_9FUNG|nr:hypothetical protein BC936DRAFT_149961 [Jimgerdemannia flammicorona]